MIREGLEQILESEPGIELVASCGSVDELYVAVDAVDVDVVLTDIRMPPAMRDEGIRVASRLRETAPEVGVVVLSQYSNPGYALQLLEDGSERRGYLLKERVRDRTQLRSAIQAVAAGGSMMDPKIVDVLVQARLHRDASPLVALTPRELDVLAEIAQGKSNAAIAESLVLTKRGREAHQLDLPEARRGVRGRRQQAGESRAAVSGRSGAVSRLARPSSRPSARARSTASAREHAASLR